ncbi:MULTISPECIES: hypothetical protein [unclassified Exiguobacterium]|uniref:hypothetical protein n=1 Tax=unclassified Exiguobacterium TaxID=2644629 RepID=UPI001BED18DE|nr:MULTISPECIES: hypothetical protein [unclassified Exiguobacterium]
MSHLQEQFKRQEKILALEVQNGISMMEEAIRTQNFQQMREATLYISQKGKGIFRDEVNVAKREFMEKLSGSLKNDGFEMEDNGDSWTFSLQKVPVLKVVKGHFLVFDRLGKNDESMEAYERRVKGLEKTITYEEMMINLSTKLLENPFYLLSREFRKLEKSYSSFNRATVLTLIKGTMLMLTANGRQNLRDKRETRLKNIEGLRETLNNLYEKREDMLEREKNWENVRAIAPKMLEKYHLVFN